MDILKEIKDIILKIEKAGFEAYVVGGCVRDLLIGKKPKDWDIATSAQPEEVQKIFPKTFYQNKFLTVTIQTESKNPHLREVQVTTFRSETKYTDKRHPDEVKFAKTIEEDLARRDFTINAMAIGIKNSKTFLVDPFNGQKDLKNKLIKAVGIPKDRLSEDALRMLRAVRFSVVLGFKIEQKTAEAIKENSSSLKFISNERIKDEFIGIIMSEKASQGIELLRKLGLLKHIVPELEQGFGVLQNKHHIYDCYQHNLRSLDYAAKKNFNKHVRIAALFHDIAKPFSKRGQGPNATFYGHEIAGAKMTAKILKRLKFSKKDIDKIVKLVRYHLFYYNVDEVSESSVRRLVRQVGQENMEELLQLRMADRIGSGVPKAEPYKLRHLKYVIEKVSKDPISVKMLKVDGKDVINILKIKPGPKIGQILNVLLGYVLLDPNKNKRDFLEKEIKRLGGLPEKELASLSKQAKREIEEIETKKDKMTKDKYWVT